MVWVEVRVRVKVRVRVRVRVRIRIRVWVEEGKRVGEGGLKSRSLAHLTLALNP